MGVEFPGEFDPWVKIIMTTSIFPAPGTCYKDF